MNMGELIAEVKRQCGGGLDTSWLDLELRMPDELRIVGIHVDEYSVILTDTDVDGE